MTMRWDETDLPNGMTPGRLNVIHLFDPGKVFNGKTYALITDLCTLADADALLRRRSRSSSATGTSRRRSASRSTAYRKAGDEVSQESSERRRPALTTSPFRS